MTSQYDLALDQRSGLPDALRVLLQEYPRDTWSSHHSFMGLVVFWMQRHMMFRELLQVMQEDVTAMTSATMEFQNYAARLRHYGGTLLQELHAHHQIEDHHYFPKLIGLDARIAQGFDLLEADHHAMDGLLEGLAESANVVLQTGEVGGFETRLSDVSALLDRHLTDEEEIIVPVLLKSGFQG